VSCDLAFVRRALCLLAAGGADCWIFGGWAEELRGLCPARAHKDVDLLCLSGDFAVVERLLRAQRLEEIAGKRFEHKRALVLDGVMVELFLVRRDQRGLFTDFWGFHRHDWPPDALSSALGFPVASTAALASYRRAHYTLQSIRSTTARTPDPQHPKHRRPRSTHHRDVSRAN
jgi:hypothetical protein